MSSPEVFKGGAENGAETRDAAAERSAELRKSPEKSVEKPHDNTERAETARREAEAAFSKESGREKRSGGEPSAPRTTHASKKQRHHSYLNTMSQIRSEMSGPSRTFSKVIHNKAVEKTSEVVGTTIARPNAILAGSIAATFFTLAMFIIAKQYGYRLSGFETIGTFLLGWLLGLIYDYLRLMLTGKRSQ